MSAITTVEGLDQAETTKPPKAAVDQSRPDVQFFMIVGEGQGPGKVIHATFQNAKFEAKRLARKFAGKRFHVLASTAVFEVKDAVE